MRRIDDYPAVFVSNESVMFTLWQTVSGAHSFDRRNNVGRHHIALQVNSTEELFALYEKLRCTGDAILIEFDPEFLIEGPAMHMMCYDPSDLRVKFILVPSPHE